MATSCVRGVNHLILSSDVFSIRAFSHSILIRLYQFLSKIKFHQKIKALEF